MRAIQILIAVAVTSWAFGPINAGGPLCNEVKAFAGSPDAESNSTGRRWVELHWRGAWLDFDSGWGISCRHSPDVSAENLCAWLEKNTSYEFPAQTPKLILKCYGYVLPAGDVWDNWRTDISLLRRTRWIKLEVNFSTLKGEIGAIRLSAFDKGKNDALAPLPALRAEPALKAGHD